MKLPVLTCPYGLRAAASGKRTLTAGALAILIAVTCGACTTPAGAPDACLATGCADTPADVCAPGQRPGQPGEPCQPVGWTTCPQGFALAASGWGCVDVTPASACAHATRERLGFADCQPVGSCDAPFPPPDATLFVSALYSASQLDATHFRALVGALAAAHAGSIIAVDEGVYPESLDLKVPVRIVGRCAEKVVLTSTSQRYTGIGVAKVVGVEVSGLTIKRHLYAAMVLQGGSLLMKNCVLDDNHALAVYASDPGSRFEMQDSVIRGTRVSADGPGWAVLSDLGADVRLSNSAFIGNSTYGVVVRNAGSTLHVDDSVVASTLLDASGGSGFGLLVYRGGSAEVHRSAFIANRGLGIIVSGADTEGASSSAILGEVVVRDTQNGLINQAAAGAMPQYGGRGISVQDRGHLEATRFTLLANTELGVALSGVGAQARFVDGAIVETRASREGILGRGLAVHGGARVELEGTALVGNLEVAVDVTEAGSEALIGNSVIRETHAEATGMISGHGLLVTQAAHARVHHSAIQATDGIGVVAAGATVLVDACLVSDNTVALHAQEGVTLLEVATAPPDATSMSLTVSSDSRFVRNQTRIGSGTVPLPSPVTVQAQP